ncbi:hypothetical protein [Ensifer adhaerens]|uniref:hypothetical protein n=1 Tax=Ensifer adhaerens TaxID=106592 RepID=UPI001178BFA0|nr:hypothetical protein [Ensifer adhaerens]
MKLFAGKIRAAILQRTCVAFAFIVAKALLIVELSALRVTDEKQWFKKSRRGGRLQRCCAVYAV